MSCREWEERIAVAARDGHPDAALSQHLEGCPDCLEFAGEMTAVAAALASWEVTAPKGSVSEAARAAWVERLAAIRQSPPGRPERRSIFRWGEHPAVIAVAGAAAMAAGALTAPGWVRIAVACWAVVAALLVSLVLVNHSHWTASEGEP